MVSCARWAATALAALLSAASAARATIEVPDDSGRRVRLAEPARRIVALSPHLTELVFSAGAGERLVGVASHSDFPPQARLLPRVGDARALDLERIVALRPDLIVAWSSGSPKRQIDRLRTLGYAVFSNEPLTLDAIATAIERIGVLTGTQEHAHASVRTFRDRLAALRLRSANAPRLRVFYQVWDHPLLTVNADHVITDALGACGADNVFAASRVRVSHPAREAVLLADPDAIVVAASPAHAAEATRAWQPWRELNAVRTGNVFAVDPNLLHRHTTRILDGVEQLCSQLERARRG